MYANQVREGTVFNLNIGSGGLRLTFKRPLTPRQAREVVAAIQAATTQTAFRDAIESLEGLVGQAPELSTY